jgi:serine protease Do
MAAMSDYKKQFKWLGVVVLLSIGVATGLIISSKLGIMNTGDALTVPPLKVSATLNGVSDALADVAAYVTPSVVNISSTKTVKQESPANPLFEDPFFRKFFGEPEGPRVRKFKEQSLGSGVIVTSDGYIVTNNHVIAGAQEIKVSLANKDVYKGKIIGADPRSDIAVIKIEATGLPAVKWGDSDKLRPGEMVMAIGIPFGLAQTVTTGIISAVGRANIGITDYEDFIQTDAAINPGNSGGALVDMRGEVVGINTAIFSQTGGYQGIGFAVPSKIAMFVMNSLIKTGKVVRGWLGVSVQDVTSELAKEFGVPFGEGALVGEVVKGSPAEKAGIKRGDDIVKFNGQKVEDSAHLRNLAASTPPGSRIKLEIIRDKKKEEIEATVGELPKEAQAAAGGEAGAVSGALSGVAVQDLTPDMIDRLGLDKDTTGVVVMSVEQGSAADEAGLTRGDVIMSVNRKPVKNAKEYDAAVRKLGKGEPVLLLINRQGSALWMSISPGD